MTIIHHSIDADDRVLMDAFRAAMAVAPRFELTPQARPAFDALMAQVPPAPSVTHEAAVVADIPGSWCRIPGASSTSAILYLHGGGYVLGSSAAYRNLAGQIASRANADVFLPDYRLAPEHPYPAAVVDALQAFGGLSGLGYRRIALAGDSAGGGLALLILSQLCQLAAEARAEFPACAAAMSPWTDLTLSGDSMDSLARKDPLLSRESLSRAAGLYLQSFSEMAGPRASALRAVKEGLPPVLLHVGADEVLLDDAIRYGQALESVGGNVEVHVWEGMTHVFPATPALAAARRALDHIGQFLREQLASRAT